MTIIWGARNYRNVSVTVLETRSLKSRCWLVPVPPKALGGSPSALAASGGFRCPCLWPNFPSVCLHLLTAYVSLVFSYKDTTSHWTSDSILTQVDFILGSLTTCMFPKKVVLQAPRWT